MAKWKSRHVNKSNSNKTEAEMVRSLDKLAQYERFVELIPEALRKDVLNGMKPNEILHKYNNVVAARMVALAMTEKDPSKAFSMMKDVLDRTEGKAIERKQIQHALHQVSDQEFDALLASDLEDLEDLEDDG